MARAIDRSTTDEAPAVDLRNAALDVSRSDRSASQASVNPWTRSAWPATTPHVPLRAVSAPVHGTASRSAKLLEEDPDISLQGAARVSVTRRRGAALWVAALTTMAAVGLSYCAWR